MNKRNSIRVALIFSLKFSNNHQLFTFIEHIIQLDEMSIYHIYSCSTLALSIINIMKQKNPIAQNKFPVSEFGIALILIGIGIIFNKFVPFADYQPFKSIFHWSTLLILIGFIRGINTKFSGMDWLILIILGTVVWIKKTLGFNLISPAVIAAIIFIILGVQLIFMQRKKANQLNHYVQQTDDTPILPFEENNQLYNASNEFNEHAHDNTYQNNQSENINNHDAILDFISVQTFFGSNSKMVLSKSLKGGNVSTVFGSATILMNKADIEGLIFIDVFCMFGEITFIMPAEFTIINNVTSIIGEYSDKRNFLNETNTKKTIILRGQVIAGTIKVKNF